MPGVVAQPAARQDTSAQLGQLLLRGWTMLAEACDTCSVPLMRDPTTRESRCVSCGATHAPDGAAAAAAASAPSPSTTAAAAPPPTSVRPANGPANGPVPVSSDDDDEAPVPRSQQQPAVDAAAADADAVNTDAEEAMRRRFEAGRAARRRQQAAGGGGVGDPAQLLADKMVAGWALLAEHCPVCSTPLMRERGGRGAEVRCVVCDLPVQTPQQVAAAAAAAAAGSAAGSAPVATAAPAAAAAAAAAAPPAARPPAPAAAAAAPAPPGQQQPQQRRQQQAVLQGLRQAVLAKLDEVTGALNAAPATQPAHFARLDGQLAVAERLLRVLALAQPRAVQAGAGAGVLAAAAGAAALPPPRGALP